MADRLRSPDSAVNHETQTRVRDIMALAGESRDGLLLSQKLKMDNKSKKRPEAREKHREKKLKSLEVEAAKCAKLTEPGLVRGIHSAQQQQVRGRPTRGGLDNG
ncbi:unnamed protein product [Pleuronectes platessa]|uniref:Uncharacterized protein n=1 Tax=Pleuronectes platessa TaxID=8262 RepID=A0A9N7V4P8_PLEPL|nr:unnamed protein product [Pleuronectes platessa]